MSAKRPLLVLLVAALLAVFSAGSIRRTPVRHPQETPIAHDPGLRAAVEAARYGVHMSDGSTGDRFYANNPAQGYQAQFSAAGLQLTPAASNTAKWRMGLTLASIGRNDARERVTGGVLTTAGARVDVVRRVGDVAVTEWFINRSSGLEHGFTISDRPAAHESGSLEVGLSLSGGLDAVVGANRQAVAFVDRSSGGTALRYDHLVVRDAAGQLLSSRFEGDGAAFRMIVDDAGAAYPVTIDPTISQQAYLKASNTDQGDQFGFAVAVSGDTVAIGALAEDSAAVGVNGNHADNSKASSGAVYVFVRSGSTWTQQAYLKASNTDANDQFGAAVALSGDTLVVGANLESSAATGVNGNQADNTKASAGAAYVFVRAGTTWTQQAYLKASNTDSNDQFGTVVAVSGDTVVVSTSMEDSGATGVDGNGADNSKDSAGAAYVFVRNGTTWTQQAYLKASNTDAGDRFGWSVAASGDTVVVGALSEASAAAGINGNQTDNTKFGTGAAYVFVRNGVTWTQQAYLKASNADQSDQFGYTVAASGDTVAVGANRESSAATGVNGNQADNSKADSGAVYVFVRSGAVWTQQAYLKASNPDASDQFGLALAVSGDVVVAGTIAEDSAATGIDGNGADNSANLSGAAYVFVRSGSTWGQVAYLKASNTDANDRFAVRVGVSGDTVIVGASTESSAATGINGNQADNSKTFSGAAYVFTLEMNAAPVANAGSDATVEATSASGATVALNGAASSDSNGDTLTYTWTDATAQVISNSVSASVVQGIGTATYTLTVSDGSLTSSDTVLVTVQDTTPPNFSIPSDQTLAATSASGAGLVYNASAHDVFDVSEPSTITCAPASGSTFAKGGTTVDCTAADSRGNSATGSFTVTVTNAAPIALGTTVTTGEDTPISIPLNGSDIDSASLTYIKVSNPSRGSVIVGPGATAVYTPSANYNGSDSFIYKVNDGSVDSNTALVTVNITAVNDAPVATADAYATNEDAPLVFLPTLPAGATHWYRAENNANDAIGGLTGTVVGSLPYADGRSGRAFSSDGANRGVRLGTGAYSASAMTMAAWVRPDNFADAHGGAGYVIADGRDCCGSSAGGMGVHLRAGQAPRAYIYDPSNAQHGLNGVAMSPLAWHHVVFTFDGTNLKIYQDGVLTGSSTIAATTVKAATSQLNIGRHGDCIAGACYPFHGLIDDVVIFDHALSAAEVQATYRRASVLDNDSDVDATTLTAVQVGQPANGTVTVNADGSFAYSPNANFAGTDSFTYQANDGVAGSNVATVTITVAPVNDAPSFTAGANQNVGAGAGAQTVAAWATAISAGPPDESAQALDFVVDTGSLGLFLVPPALSPDGTLTYTPAASPGSATVTVRLHDNGGTANGSADTSAPQVFTITIVDVTPPVLHLPENLSLIATSAAGAPAIYAVAAEDREDGSVGVSCSLSSGAIAPIGTTTVQCSAHDAAGNTVSGGFTVAVRYNVTLLYDPTKGSKSGSTIPIRVQLSTANGENLSSSAVVVHATAVVQLPGDASCPPEDAGGSNPDSNFRYDSSLNGYIFNLKSTGLTPGTYELRFTAGASAGVSAAGFTVR